MQRKRPCASMLTWSLVLLLVGLAGCTAVPRQDASTQQPQPAPPARETPVQLGPRIYVANESSNSVTVIDGVSFTTIGNVDTRNQATHDLVLSRDGWPLFTTNLACRKLSVIDTNALETIATFPTGSRCHVVTLTNDNRYA